MQSSLQNKAVKGVIWSAVERFSVQGIQFILSIVIARLVAPSEYGLIAMLGIFFAIAQTFIDSGFSNALIQKQDCSDIDFSTVFYFNIVLAVLFYLLLFFTAPFIADFYREPLLTVVTRWVGLNIVISAFSIVQRAKLTIQLDFKTQAKASLVSVLLSGLAGIIMAWLGYGVWALVTQALLSTFLNSLLLWILSRWIPLWAYSWQSFKRLFAFGSKLLLSGLLHTLYLNLYSLVIGKKYSATNVGYYNRAYSLAQYPSVNIVGVITRAIYPVQCELQNDEKRLQDSFLQYLRMACYIVFPLMVGVAVLAQPLVLLVLTEKWLPAAELLSILCLAYMWYPVMVINNQILNVKGRSDYFLKAEIIKKIVAIAILFVTLPFGLKVLCWGIVLYNILDCVIIIHFTKKVIKTGYREQIQTIFPLFAINMIMAGSVWRVSTLFHHTWQQLAGGIIFGIGIYIALSLLFKVDLLNKFIFLLKLKNKQ